MPFEMKADNSPLLISRVTVARKLTAGGLSCGSGYDGRVEEGLDKAASPVSKKLRM